MTYTIPHADNMINMPIMPPNILLFAFARSSPSADPQMRRATLYANMSKATANKISIAGLTIFFITGSIALPNSLALTAAIKDVSGSIRLYIVTGFGGASLTSCTVLVVENEFVSIFTNPQIDKMMNSPTIP